MTTFTGSYGAAGAVSSFNGADVSSTSNADHNLRTCDRESDSHIVKGGVSFNDDHDEVASVTDGSGNDASCGSRKWQGAGIQHHHTCERSIAVWGCGNWVAE